MRDLQPPGHSVDTKWHPPRQWCRGSECGKPWCLLTDFGLGSGLVSRGIRAVGQPCVGQRWLPALRGCSGVGAVAQRPCLWEDLWGKGGSASLSPLGCSAWGRDGEARSESCWRGAATWPNGRGKGWLPDRPLRPVNGCHAVLCKTGWTPKGGNKSLTKVAPS